MQFRPRGGPPRRFGSLAEYPPTPNQRRFVPSRDETAAQCRRGRHPTMTAPQISAPAFDTDLRQGPAPQPSITSRPRRTGQPRRACGSSPPARSRFAAPITQGAAGALLDQSGAAAPAGPAPPPPPLHCARPPCGAGHAAWRIGQRRFGGLAHACGHAVAGRGRESAERRTRRPQRPRRPVRPSSGRALQAQAAQDRIPVCGQNSKKPRRRAAGRGGFRIGSSTNRRAAPRARRRKALPADPARRSAPRTPARDERGPADAKPIERGGVAPSRSSPHAGGGWRRLQIRLPTRFAAPARSRFARPP